MGVMLKTRFGHRPDVIDKRCHDRIRLRPETICHERLEWPSHQSETDFGAISGDHAALRE